MNPKEIFEFVELNIAKSVLPKKLAIDFIEKLITILKSKLRELNNE